MQVAEIRSDARFFVSPQLTSTEYPDATLDFNANRWYRQVLVWALEAQGEWEIQGDIAYRDGQTGVTTYALPDNLLVIERVEVKLDGVNFITANPIRLIDQPTPEGNTTRVIDDPNAPTYDLFGPNLVIRPGFSTDVVNGIKIWLQKDFTDLDGTTYKTPQIPEPVRRILSIGAAFDYAIAEEMYKKASELKKMIFGDPLVPNDTGLKGAVETLYSMQANNRRKGLKARRESFR